MALVANQVAISQAGMNKRLLMETKMAYTDGES